MPIIDTSLTLENLEKSKASILELLSNPHADEEMIKRLTKRLANVNQAIRNLETPCDHSHKNTIWTKGRAWRHCLLCGFKKLD